MEELTALLALAYTSLLAIINPIGAVPLYLAITATYTKPQRRRTLLRALITALLVLLAFATLGTLILRFFGITTYAFKIAGGIIFFGIGWDMLQAKRSRVKTTEEEELEGTSKEDVGIIPLGIPTLAGPGAITTIIALLGQATTVPQKAMIYTALVLVLLTTWAILAAAPTVLRASGQTGLNVMTRIMGLLVTVIGVQFVLDGLSTAARELL
ncbi:MAG TPA: MarC family protein [Longimicrobiales bacterium]|nr:MarC family protein [Longimicrobiales bacterium]